jgi:hypothetical protein
MIHGKEIQRVSILGLYKVLILYTNKKTIGMGSEIAVGL